MARRLKIIDRDTPLLLPPSIQDWVGPNDIARFILDAVAVVADSGCRYNWRGTGSAQYPPRMMLALLIHSYAHGVFSSRAIERATWRDIATRFITGDTHPDHDTIAAFRRGNGRLLHACFVQVIELARETGVPRIGSFAIDGTKLEASAARRRTLSLKDLRHQLQALDGKISTLLATAEQADHQDGGAAQDMPAELADATARRSALQRAKQQLEARNREVHEQRRRERDDHDDEGPGAAPRVPGPEPRNEDTVNLTDPDARLMPCKQGGWMAGYNGQIAVRADPGLPLIVATRVCDESNDRRQLLPMARKIIATTPGVGRLLADTGYDNTAQIHRLETRHGIEVHCPPERRHRDARGASVGKRESKARRRTRRFREAMAERMEGEAGRLSRQLRGTTVEPVFGWIKKTLGFGRFHLRGLAKVNLEWELVCLAFNVRLLHRRMG